MPNYSLSRDFHLIDALTTAGANFNTPADPLSLNIKVSPSTDLNTVIEEVTAPSSQLVRLQTGTWLFNLTPSLYNNSTTYEARFRFFMSPGNLSVKRQTFTFNEIPNAPTDITRGIVYGTLKNTRGVPVNNASIYIETFKDFVTLNNKLQSNEIKSNGFGHWWIELDVGTTVRFVLGDYSKAIVVPGGVNKLSDVPEWTGKESNVRVDRFGYPY